MRTPDGAYLPLDNRTLAKLREMDVRHRYPDRQEKHLGRLVEAEMRSEQDQLDAEKRKREEEESRERIDRVAFGFRKYVEHRASPHVRMA